MYTPNFSDPRVAKRIKTALGFACGVMSETKSHPWSTRHIDKYFGQQTTDISKYLRKILLIETNSHWNKDTGECKEYILNARGVDYLREALKINNILIYPIVYDLAQKDHSKELTSGDFQYKDKSNRLWHPLQRYRKEYRSQILNDSGYLHDYDIECAAPTLIHQYAQHLGMDEYLFALRRYLTNRVEVRNELANKLELEPAAAKEIINALFAGARIANHEDSDIYHILNGDRARIDLLKEDQYIAELRCDIKTCWDYISPTISRRTRTQANGKERLLAITCKQRWHVYFELERKVLNSVRNYLDEIESKYFLIHDGWMCDREIDKDQLIDYVRNQTEFDVRFEYEKK